MDDKSKPFVICGVNAVAEKLKSAPGDILELMVATGRLAPRLAAIVDDARRRGVTVRPVDWPRLTAWTDGALHQGIAAAVAPPAYADFERLLDAIKAEPRRLLVLDGITDPRNFGALLRSAEGAGIRDVLIAKDRAVGVTPVVVKSSAGAANHLQIYRVTNIVRALAELKERGCWIVGLDAEASESIYDREYPPTLAVVLGSEGKGMRPIIRRECDFLAVIPMMGKIGSLNVSVAGAVFLYELARQARAAGQPKSGKNR